MRLALALRIALQISSLRGRQFFIISMIASGILFGLILGELQVSRLSEHPFTSRDDNYIHKHARVIRAICDDLLHCACFLSG